jgi:transcriptional regulator with GAF, ATPase, and Fis domain
MFVQECSFLPEGGVLVASNSRLWQDRHIQELSGCEHRVGLAHGGADALEKLESGRWSTLFLSPNLPDLDPFEVAALAEERFPRLEIRFLASETQIATGETSASVRHFPTRSPELLRNDDDGEAPGCKTAVYGHPQSRGVEPLPGMVGNSQPMQRVYEMARRVAPRLTTVLITGATGTGKELVARALHQLSPRGSRAFAVVNCAAIPEALLESELFGHVRGAFTGAVQSHAGRIFAANGGTLFLDEVGDLPLDMQAKLLRFIEQKEIQRLGSSETSRVDVRVLAASNADLPRKVADKSFRQDLFYRLSVFCLELPPLASRVDDISPLAQYFLECVRRTWPEAPARLTQQATGLLTRHSWPGNVRELQLVIERACILGEGEPEIGPEHICFPGTTSQPSLSMRGLAV